MTKIKRRIIIRDAGSLQPTDMGCPVGASLKLAPTRFLYDWVRALTLFRFRWVNLHPQKSGVLYDRREMQERNLLPGVWGCPPDCFKIPQVWRTTGGLIQYHSERAQQTKDLDEILHYVQNDRCGLRGAGFFLPGVWGCSPDCFKIPQSLGDYRGLDDELIHYPNTQLIDIWLQVC